MCPQGAKGTVALANTSSRQTELNYNWFIINLLSKVLPWEKKTPSICKELFLGMPLLNNISVGNRIIFGIDCWYWYWLLAKCGGREKAGRWFQEPQPVNLVESASRWCGPVSSLTSKADLPCLRSLKNWKHIPVAGAVPFWTPRAQIPGKGKNSKRLRHQCLL